MLKQYHHIFGGLFRLIDACVIGIVWLLSYWLRFQIPIIEVTKGFPPFSQYAALAPLIILLWMLVFSSLGVYQSRRMLRRTHEAQLILKAHGFALLFFIAITYLFSEYKYSRGVILFFGILGAILLVGLRLSLRNILRNMRRKGYNLRHLLLIGEGSSVETLVKKIDRFPELGLRINGALVHEKSQAKSVAGKPVLGTFSQIAELVRKTQVDQVLIALPKDQYGELDRILAFLKEEMIDIKIIPDIHEYVTLGCEVEDFDGMPIVNLNESPLYGWSALAKRATDMILAGLGLICLLPVFFLLAILIRLSSRGPVLYRQERMGIDGKTFEIIKFRSMRPNAEQSTGAVWAKPGDERRTALGAFLRASNLDELPQLWNVLKGDMSLVGPRPERPVFVQQFRHQIPLYMLRHRVKAGMTGWAQVNGWRGDTSLDRRIECDLYYIRHWSYALDLKILVMTFVRGFVDKNAY